MFLILTSANSQSLVADVVQVLRAGAATRNITPPLGTLRVGSFAPYHSVHVHDEPHACCLVLNDGDTTLALVVCDLVGFHLSVSVEARRLIEKIVRYPAGSCHDLGHPHPFGRNSHGHDSLYKSGTGRLAA